MYIGLMVESKAVTLYNSEEDVVLIVFRVQMDSAVKIN